MTKAAKKLGKASSMTLAWTLALGLRLVVRHSLCPTTATVAKERIHSSLY